MKNLRINSIEIYKANLDIHKPFTIAIMEIRRAQNLFVKINTSEGIYGTGESSPNWRITGETQESDFAIAQDIAKLLMGKNPLPVEARTKEMNDFLIHNASIRSAFDMALYDILGKVADLPLYALLGGQKRPICTDYTISIEEPEKMAEQAVAYKKLGYRAIKIKLGTNFENDINIVTKIRELIGNDTPLRLDANQGWNCRSAILVLTALEPMNIEYCEQPVAFWDDQSMRRVRDKTNIAIMADESVFDHHDALRLAKAGCCDHFNIKLAKSGGIHTALKINHLAESAGMGCMVGCMMETRLGLTAAAHLASARPNIRWADLDGFSFHKIDPIIGGAVFQGSNIDLSDAPGHGADIDPMFLQNCETITVC